MLTDLVFDWAGRTPDKLALEYNGEAWSYRDFADRIAVMRGHFHRRGVTGEGVAVLLIYNLRDFWVVSLALRSLGLTTLAVQSVDAVRRLSLPDLRWVVTISRERWDGLEALCDERGTAHWPVAPEDGPPLGLDETERYRPGGHILQTSGTTGQFKLVLFDPSFELDFLRLRREINGNTASSVITVFEFGGWTGVGYKSPASIWAVGGSVVLSQGRAPHLVFRRGGITHAVVVPGMLTAILAQPLDAFPRSETMQLSVTGGTITQAQIDEAKARITPRIYNGLGATETNSIAYTPLNSPDDHRWHQLIPGRRIEIVDEFDRPVPTGQVGRLRVSTAGGPTSYLHDEEATRAFFRNGFFYPGDLAFVREDGRMALQGRVTDVINVNGQKIAPAPIEDRLREVLGVSGVCIVSMQNENGDEELHFVFETPKPLDTERIGAAIQSELQGMYRARLYFVAALPRNAMSKVLRHAVTARVLAAREPAASGVR